MSATVRAKMMAERARDGGADVAETAQEKRARLRAPVKVHFDRMEEEERRLAPVYAAASRRRWEARWKAREAREKAARARRLAAQDQGAARRGRLRQVAVLPGAASGLAGWLAGGRAGCDVPARQTR